MFPETTHAGCLATSRSRERLVLSTGRRLYLANYSLLESGTKLNLARYSEDRTNMAAHTEPPELSLYQAARETRAFISNKWGLSPTIHHQGAPPAISTPASHWLVWARDLALALATIYSDPFSSQGPHRLRQRGRVGGGQYGGTLESPGPVRPPVRPILNQASPEGLNPLRKDVA